MTYAVTLTPEHVSYKLMHLRWHISDPSAPVARHLPRVLHDDHPDVIRQNLSQIGIGVEDIERILYMGATVELTQAQIADLGILLDRAELTNDGTRLLVD